MLTHMNNSGNQQESISVLSFLLELVVYALLITVYFLLVLHFLGGMLLHLFMAHRITYAFVALALIVAQGWLLQTLTTSLLHFFRRLLKQE